MSNKDETDRVFRRLEAAKEAIKKPDNMRLYGLMAVEFIRIRTRLGYSVREDGEKRERLKPLSDSYIEQRTRDKKNGKLSDQTSAKRSNLTRTGQMLDSLDIVSVKPGHVKVEPTGSRNDSKSDNKEIAGYVAKQGRPFLSLSDLEIKKLRNEIRKDFNRLLKR